MNEALIPPEVAASLTKSDAALDARDDLTEDERLAAKLMLRTHKECGSSQGSDCCAYCRPIVAAIVTIIIEGEGKTD